MSVCDAVHHAQLRLCLWLYKMFWKSQQGFCKLRSEATGYIILAGAVQQLMQGVAALAVPLTVNVSCGQQWGTLHRM